MKRRKTFLKKLYEQVLFSSHNLERPLQFFVVSTAIVLLLSTVMPALSLQKYLHISSYETVLAENSRHSATSSGTVQSSEEAASTVQGVASGKGSADTSAADATAAETANLTKQELIYVSLNPENLPAKVKRHKQNSTEGNDTAETGTSTESAAGDTQAASDSDTASLADTAYKTAYAVNYFQAQTAVNVDDYGNYKKVTNLNPDLNLNTEKIDEHTQKVSFALPAKSIFYYQGLLEQQQIPWLFEFTYRLDDEIIEPEAIAGLSGNFSLTVNVSANPNADSSYFESYLLQLNFTLPLANFTALQVNDGQVSVAAGNSNVSFIVLPKQQASFTIKAQVKDCVLPSSMFYALPITFDLEKFSLPTDKIGDLQQLAGGISQLNNAAFALKSGFDALNGGIQALSGGADELAQSGDALVGGAYTLAYGLDQYADGVKQYVNGVKQVDSGISRINNEIAGFQGLMESKFANFDTIRRLLRNLDQALAPFASGIDKLLSDDTFKNLLQQAETADLQTDLELLIKTLDELISYLEKLHGTTSALSNLQIPNLSRRFNLDALDLPAPEQLSSAILAGIDLDSLDLALAPYNVEATELAQLKDTLRQNIAAAVNNGVNNYFSEYAATLAATKADLAKLFNETDAELDTFNNDVRTLSSASQPDLEKLLTALKTLREKLASADDTFKQLHTLLQELQTAFATRNKLENFPQNYAELKAQVEAFLADFDNLQRLFKDGNNGEISLIGALKLLGNGTARLMDNAPSLLAAGQELSAGSKQLSQGIVQYVGGAGKLAAGSKELATGGLSYAEGFGEFARGLQQLQHGTADIDAKTAAEIKKVISELLGQDFRPHSFLSAANQPGTVSQFIFVYPGISKLQTAESTEETDSGLSFFEKLKALFA